MWRHIDDELAELKNQLLEMGGCVERALEEAVTALLTRDATRLSVVHQFEQKIDQAHMDVDSACLKLLARQSPLAHDLRWVVAVIKINTDLERMGDQAVNIAQSSERYLSAEPLKPLIDIPKMAKVVQMMVRKSLDALVKLNEGLAREVLDADDQVDAFKSHIFRELLELMKTRPSEVEQAMNLILIARNLERIGDHATNIAEDVIFAATGKDIRHGNRGEESGEPRS